MSESNRVKLIIVPETTYGTTPTDSADWQTLRYTSETLSGTPQTVTSNEIRSDRMTADMTRTGLQVQGEVSVELSTGTFDDLIAGAFASDWQADTPVVGSDTIEIGTSDKSFSIEKQFTDESKYLAFRGMRVGQLSLNFQYGQVLTGGFTFAGNGTESVVSSLVGAGSVTAATTTKVLNASTDISSIKIDGSAVTGIEIQSISMQLNNNLRAIEAVGNDAPVDQKKGTASITGTIQAYMSADAFAWYQKSLDQTDVALEFSVTDGTNTYTFTLPRIHLNVQAPQSGGLDQDVMISADYTALYDGVSGTSLKLVRS